MAYIHIYPRLLIHAGVAILWNIWYSSLFIQVHWLRVQHGVGEAQPPALQASDHQGPDCEPRSLLQQAAQRLQAFLRHPHRRDQDLHHCAGVREDEVSRGPCIRK